MEEEGLGGREQEELGEETPSDTSFGEGKRDVLPLMEEEEPEGLDGEGEDGESTLERC